MGSSPSFLDPVVLPLIRGESILDIGCGFGRWGCLMRTNFFEWGLDKFPTVDGIDGDPKCVAHCKSLNVYSDLYCTILPGPLPDKKYDTVLASEIVEHLKEDEVHTFLAAIEKIANQRVIITTPNFQCLRGGSESPLGFNELDHHQSYVSQNFLKKHGYSICGAGFRAATLAPKLLLRLSRLFGIRDWWLFVGFSYFVPKWSHTTVAFKNVSPAVTNRLLHRNY